MQDFMAGVIAMMIANIISLFALKRFENHIPIFALISSGSVLVFGGITLFIHIPSIFILRDTIFDAIFGTVILISVWYDKPIFKYIFGGVFSISDIGWRTLSLRWGIFFLNLAVINELIRQTLTPEDWVAAKIIMIVASLFFGIYQLKLTKKERLPDATAWGIRK
jgi:intracellular septation protein